MSLYNFYPFNHEGIVLADAECAVLKGREFRDGLSGHCGYCVFPRDEIPEEWHGNYNADSLGYGIAHGGLTYAEVCGWETDENVAAVKALWAEKEARYKENEAAGKDFVNLWSEYTERADKLKKSFPYTHVVFGFDTAHYGDAENGALHDANYIMQLTREMRQEIAARAKRYKVTA